MSGAAQPLGQFFCIGCLKGYFGTLDLSKSSRCFACRREFEMAEFKVGDRVKCVSGFANQVLTGGVYTVVRREYPSHAKGDWLHVIDENGRPGDYARDRFVPATLDATPAPVVGEANTAIPADFIHGVAFGANTGGMTFSAHPLTFQKNDAGKSRVDLIPPTVLEELGHVLRIGAEKYDADNWRRGAEWRRYIGASLRHIYAFARGEDKDPETGYSHLAHAMAGLCFLFEYARCGLGTDDRWKGK